MPKPSRGTLAATTPSNPSISRRKWLRHTLALPATSAMAPLLAACGGGKAGDASPARRTDYHLLIENAKAQVRDALGDEKLSDMGISIALTDGVDTLWADGFGMADAANRQTATAATRYEAGSITKLFTGIAVMQLVEQGLLDLDLPIERYVPGFHIKSRWAQPVAPITARMLLSHHAGIPDQSMAGGYADRPLTLAETVAMLAQETLAYPPGTLFAYSNLGYAVLGRAIECASGMPYATYVEQRLLAPLGMAASAMRPQNIEPNAAGAGYPAPDDVAPCWLENGVADGGLRTTVQDLARFARACLRTAAGQTTGRLPLTSGTLAEMWQPQFSGKALDLDAQTGLAWMPLALARDAATQRAVQIQWHGGTSVHHRGVLALLPEYDLGIAVLCNHSQSQAFVTGLALQMLVDAARLKGGLSTTALGHPVLPAFTRTQEPQRHEGIYVLRNGTVVRLRAAEGALAVEAAGSLQGTLVPQHDGFFEVQAAGAESDRVAFDQLEGVELLLRYGNDGQRSLFATRLPALPAIDAAWAAHCGTYGILPGQRREILSSARLFMDGHGLLCLEMMAPMFAREPMSLCLAPQAGGSALILGLGQGRQETVHMGSNGAQDFITVFGVTLHRVTAA